MIFTDGNELRRGEEADVMKDLTTATRMIKQRRDELKASSMM